MLLPPLKAAADWPFWQPGHHEFHAELLCSVAMIVATEKVEVIEYIELVIESVAAVLLPRLPAKAG